MQPANKKSPMASVNFDMTSFESSLVGIVKNLSADNLLRPVCIELVTLMTDRIHIKGLASDGTSIGE